MARYAMVATATGRVENVVLWDGDTTGWQPPEGYTMIEDDPPTVSTGWTWDGTEFHPPAQQEPPA